MEGEKSASQVNVLSILRRHLEQKVQEVKSETNAQAHSQATRKERAEDILDTKMLDGNLFYLVKWMGTPEPRWEAVENLSANLLVEVPPSTIVIKDSMPKVKTGTKNGPHSRPKIYHQEPPITNTTKTLELVVDALKSLGGKGFGPQIVDWIMTNKPEATRMYGNKKKLRYTINGLLSSRVNSNVFVKQLFTDKGGTKTEWKLVDLNYIPPKAIDPISPVAQIEINNNHNHVDHSNSLPSTPVVSPVDADGNEVSSEDENDTEAEESAQQANQQDDEMYQLPKHEQRMSTPKASITPQPTYRDMIKHALNAFGGESTFDQITKYIENTFKDQLLLKAETWKHSIAGCLSVYFSRREYKDNTGKVIWTLHGDPPTKKKRRKMNKKEDSDSGGKAPKRTRSQLGEDLITVSAETYEALEEENEALKLMLARAKSARNSARRAEATVTTPVTPVNTTPNANVNPISAANQDVCSCCKRNYLGLVILPCKHIFCGIVFCEASMVPHCVICGTYITGKIPREREEIPTEVP